MRTDGTRVRDVTRSAIWDSGVDWGPAPPAPGARRGQAPGRTSQPLGWSSAPAGPCRSLRPPRVRSALRTRSTSASWARFRSPRTGRLAARGDEAAGSAALLLLRANEVVSLDRLIDELWGESPPESAANIVQGYVSHLRKTLEPGRGRGEHELLVSRPPGYMLRIQPEQYDAERFVAADRRRPAAPRRGRADSAAERLRERRSRSGVGRARRPRVRALRAPGGGAPRGAPARRARGPDRRRSRARP